MARRRLGWARTAVLVTGLVATNAVADQILQTSGFSDCGSDSSIKVNKIDISYNNGNKTISFDVSGTSSKAQNVSAILNVTAYGNNVYSKEFNPCDAATFVDRLCPVPVGTFAARGSQQIPSEFASQIPGIAFQVPDISAQATLKLIGLNDKKEVACIRSDVSNGKTTDVPAVSYVAMGVAGAALVLSGVSAAGAAMSGGGAGGHGGGMGTISPTFTETMGWFQGMAMNSMLSVNYPPIYRSFSKNFAFSTAMIPWTGLQTSIDSMRQKTGGNLTEDSVAFLRNATLIFPDGTTRSPNQGLFNFKRSLDTMGDLIGRGIDTSVNASDSGKSSDSKPTGFPHNVQGIQAFAEQLLVPKSDVFMTALLVVAIAIATVAVAILLVKVILEAWAIFGNFPEGLKGFRKHYWGSIARTITSLILLFYGIWVLYCMYQFTNGDSVVAKALAGASLGVFTAVLAFFSWKIWSTVRKLRQQHGDAQGLYDEKSIWVKYSIFYDAYRKQYWWLFVPAILYMFAKGCAIAIGDGHGMAQTIAQMVIEATMLGLLLWSRPFERRSGNIINIVIQTVRVLSIACILVFVEEFGVKQTTQTVAGVALIAVQAALTGIMAILICWNGISACCRMNPHRKRRKEKGEPGKHAHLRQPLTLNRTTPA